MLISNYVATSELVILGPLNKITVGEELKYVSDYCGIMKKSRMIENMVSPDIRRHELKPSQKSVAELVSLCYELIDNLADAVMKD